MDVDNTSKAILDAFKNAGIIHDDSKKWVRAIRNLIVEQELVSKEEIEARIAKVSEDFKANGRDVAPTSVPWDDTGAASNEGAS